MRSSGARSPCARCSKTYVATSYIASALSWRVAQSLARGPMLRATTARLADQARRLGMSMRTVATDGGSIVLLIDEIARSLAAQAPDGCEALAPLSVRYADFDHWWLAQACRPACERQLAYWRHNLYGLAPLHGIPTDRPRPQVKQTWALRVARRLNAACERRLAAPAGSPDSVAAGDYSVLSDADLEALLAAEVP